LQDIDLQYGINDDASKQAAEGRLQAGRADEQQLLQRYQDAENDYNAEKAKVDQIKEDYKAKQDLLQTKQELEETKANLEAELSTAPAKVDNQLDAAKLELKKIEYKRTLRQLDKTAKDIDAIDKKYSGNLEAEYTQVTTPDPSTGKTVLEQKEQAAKDAKDAYEDKKQANDELAAAISEYTSATADIEMYEAAIEKRNEDFDKWDDEHHDYYVELMGFWDFMQTGKTKSLFNLGRKRIQKRYDKVRSDGKTKMDHVYEKWIHRHGYDK
jgi:chromosome segregation ATPase